MYNNLTTMIVVGAIDLAAFAAGRAAMRALRLAPSSRAETLAWSCLLGWPIWAVMLLALGLLGGLTRECVGVATLCGAFWGVGELVALGSGPRRGGPMAPPDGGAQPHPLPADTALTTLALMAAAAAVVVALAPAVDSDLLQATFAAPKQWTTAGRISFVASGGSSVLSNAWTAWALLLDGHVAARVVYAEAGLLLTAAVWLLARPILGTTGGRMAAMTTLLAPGLLGAMTRLDPHLFALALATAGLAAWRRASVDRDAGRWTAAGGALLGFAAVILAVVWGLAAAALLARLLTLRSHAATPGDAAREMLVFGGAALAIGGAGVVCEAALWGTGKTTVSNDAVAGPLVIVEWLRSTGVVILALAPALLAARRVRGLGMIGILIAAQAAAWCVHLTSSGRSPVWTLIPLASVPAAWAWVERGRFSPHARAAFATPVVLAAALAAAPTVASLRGPHRVALGLTSRSDYLADACPVYRAARIANDMRRHWPPGPVISEDACTVWFDAPVTAAVAEDSGSLDRTVQEGGFAYALVCEPFDAGGRIVESPLGRIVRRELPRRSRQPARLASYVAHRDDADWRYELYLLH